MKVVFLQVGLTVITSRYLGVVGRSFVHLMEVVAIVMVHEKTRSSLWRLYRSPRMSRSTLIQSAVNSHSFSQAIASSPQGSDRQVQSYDLQFDYM